MAPKSYIRSDSLTLCIHSPEIAARAGDIAVLVGFDVSLDHKMVLAHGPQYLLRSVLFVDFIGLAEFRSFVLDRRNLRTRDEGRPP